MRRLKRSIIRHYAEKSKYKTIKYFRYLWKELRSPKGYIAVDGGKQVKKKSLLRRKIGQALKGGAKS